MSSPTRLSLQPRRSSHDEPTSPAPVVAQALALRPFPTRDARRDTSVALVAFKDAWKALDSCTVLSQSCRRFGERAAEVLLGASGALRDAEEREASQGVQASKGYEFEGKATAATVFAVKSVMLDVKAFAQDFSSHPDRTALLVHGIPTARRSLGALTTSLSSCAAVYSLSLDTASWGTEDDLDFAQDSRALPRLFQLSIALRGPTYDGFLAAHSPPPGETGKRRPEYLEWCYEQQPRLRPDPSSPLTPRKWSAPSSPAMSSSFPSPSLVASQRRRASEGPAVHSSSSEMRRTASTSSSSAGVGLGLPSRGVEMLRRASAPGETSPLSLLDAADKEESSVVVEETASNKGVVEDEELMEGALLRGRRPSDDASTSYASSVSMSPSSSVNSYLVSMAASAPVVVVPDIVDEAPADEETVHLPAAELSTNTVKPEAAAALASTPPSGLAEALVAETEPTSLTGQPEPRPAVATAPNPSAPQLTVDCPPAVDTPDPILDKLPTPPSTPCAVSPLPTIPEDIPRAPLGVPTLTLRPATPISRPASPPPIGLRILALDGGGIRGLSLLLTLKSTLAATPPPCEQFDLITGIGTGALVAILLGRLRLDLDSALELYSSIASSAFMAKEPSTRSRWSKLFGGGSATTSTGARDRGLESACSTYLPSAEMSDPCLLADADDSICKTAILAYQQTSRGSTPCWFRSYEQSPLSLRETLHASMASTPFFRAFEASTSTSTSSFAQAPSTSLNPSDATLDEVHRLFGADAPISHFLSIGVGSPPSSLRLTSKGKSKSLAIVRQLGLASRSSAERFQGRVKREGWAEAYRRVEVALGEGEDPGVEEWVSARGMGEAVARWCARDEVAVGVKSWLSGEAATISLNPSYRKPKLSHRPSLRKSMSLDDFGDARQLYLHNSGSTGSLNLA